MQPTRSSCSSRRTRPPAPSSPTTSPPTATRCSPPTARPARSPRSKRGSPTWCICDVNGDTLGLLDAVATADGFASPDRPRRAADRAHRTRRRARARALPRARRRRRRRQAVQLPRAARPRPAPSCGAARAARRGSRASASCAIDHAGAHVRLGETPVELRRRSTRCSSTWPPTRRACSPSTSCCATSGATARPVAPARWTATPAGCGTSSAPPGTGAGSRTCGASATDSPALASTREARERGMRRAPLRRRAPRRRAARTADTAARAPRCVRDRGAIAREPRRRAPMAASDAQRAKIVGALVRRLPADQGHHARPPGAARARRLRPPRLRGADVLAAPPHLRHRAARAAALPGAALARRRSRTPSGHLGLISAYRRLTGGGRREGDEET